MIQLDEQTLYRTRKIVGGDISMCEGCYRGNSVAGSLLSITLGIPRQYAEEYVKQVQFELLTEDLDQHDED